MPFLEVEALTKSYRRGEVISDLSFSVSRGEFLVVFGPSGSGKTVLLRLLAGMVQPDRGRVRVGGIDVTDDDPEHRDVAMAFQNFALYPHMTAFENIASPLRARKLPSDKLRSRVEEAGRLLRIEHVLGNLPRALSNGQKQRTALARALVSEPSVLLLDDPLRNVDAKVRYEMRLELPRLLRSRDTTVVYVTQDYKEAMALGDRIAVLGNGGFVQVDRPETIYNRPANTSIARLFGDPPINLLPVALDGRGLRVARTDIVAPPDLARAAGSAWTLGVRPEDVSITMEERQGAIPVEIDAITPMNDRQVMLLRADDGTEIFASQPQGAGGSGRERLRQRAWAALDPGRFHLFETASGARI